MYIVNMLYFYRMRAYLTIIDNKINIVANTSLKASCAYVKVSYDSASRGKRTWVKGGIVTEIVEINIIKIKNRGKKR